MRYLGLDLGTNSLGMAITDKTRTIARSFKVARFKNSDYKAALDEVIKVINLYDIEKIVLGLPKNMNNSEGFAAQRSLEFKKLLENSCDIPIYLIDERLTTSEAEKYLLDADLSRGKRKKVIDGVAAQIILETFMRRENGSYE